MFAKQKKRKRSETYYFCQSVSLSRALSLALSLSLSLSLCFQRATPAPPQTRAEFAHNTHLLIQLRRLGQAARLLEASALHVIEAENLSLSANFTGAGNNLTVTDSP